MATQATIKQMHDITDDELCGLLDDSSAAIRVIESLRNRTPAGTLAHGWISESRAALIDYHDRIAGEFHARGLSFPPRDEETSDDGARD